MPPATSAWTSSGRHSATKKYVRSLPKQRSRKSHAGNTTSFSSGQSAGEDAVVWRAAVAAAPNVVAPILAAPPSFPRHWLGTQRDLNHRGDRQNALRGRME